MTPTPDQAILPPILHWVVLLPLASATILLLWTRIPRALVSLLGIGSVAGAKAFPIATDMLALTLQDARLATPSFVNARGRGADGWRVLDARCPHQDTLLEQDALAGHQLTCPRHGWQFDLSSGACTAHGNQPLRQWDCRLHEGRLQAYW